jgi:putative copper export protein
MPTLVQGIHLTAAAIGVGGLAFLLFILMPSLGTLPPEQRGLVAKQVVDRFRWIIWSSILALLVSGLYSIRQYYWEVAWGKSWAVLTVKIVLALFLFLIALALTLPLGGFDRVRARGQTWLAIAVGLGVAVIFIAAYLRR